VMRGKSCQLGGFAMKPGPKPQDPVVLFWNKVGKGQPDDCWEWTASRSRKGYGQCGWRGKSKQTHRVAYMLSNNLENIPAGYQVLHTCDNPPCCNPRHLRLGTAKDNSADMVAKSRQHIPEQHTHCHRGHEYSEENTTWVWQHGRTYLARRCKACQSDKYRAYHQKTRNTRLAKMREWRLAKKADQRIEP